MRVTIIKDDSKVGVDGDFRRVDLSDLSADIHAVQWYGNHGEIEYRRPRKNVKLEEFTPFAVYLERWRAAPKKQAQRVAQPE